MPAALIHPTCRERARSTAARILLILQVAVRQILVRKRQARWPRSPNHRSPLTKKQSERSFRRRDCCREAPTVRRPKCPPIWPRLLPHTCRPTRPAMSPPRRQRARTMGLFRDLSKSPARASPSPVRVHSTTPFVKEAPTDLRIFHDDRIQWPPYQDLTSIPVKAFFRWRVKIAL